MDFERPVPTHRFWKGKEQGGGFLGLCMVTTTLGRTTSRRSAPLAFRSVSSSVEAAAALDGYHLEWSIALSPPPFAVEPGRPPARLLDPLKARARIRIV